MPIENRNVVCSNTDAQRIVGADNMPHNVVLHNATKSNNQYIFVGGGSAVANVTHGIHIDPGQTMYVELGPGDELWATSDPDELVVQVMDVRKAD